MDNDLGAFTSLSRSNITPLFCTCEGAIQEALGEIDPSSIPHVQGKLVQHLVPKTRLAPFTEMPMAGQLGWVACRDVLPRGSLTAHPKDAIQYLAQVLPRPASTVLLSGASLKKILYQPRLSFVAVNGSFHATLHAP